ncbi:hypothetical protein [Paenibacillus terrae]|uniref:Uncharacterized protein n=1 Tax=Paenibacillus terrae TaxID=159743 RepID=A0A0D7WY32_9BACL|nr:hypothetical protein [Paenibacillus terrae]KJD42652.1 hypothetical protein QD47_26955 [Paenibacillus terrae]
MKRFDETAIKISELISSSTFSRYINYIQNGLSDIQRIWNNESWDDILENYMNNYWEDLIDLNENPYWSPDNTTNEDKILVFSKLKKAVFSTIHKNYQALLEQRLKLLLGEGTELWDTFKESVNDIYVIKSSADIWKLRNQIDKLLLHYTLMEKTKLVWEGPLNYSDISLTTPELQNIEFVPPTHLGTEVNEDPSATLPELVDITNSIIEDQSTLYKDIDKKDNKITYVFKRNLKGGIVPNLPPKGAFIPERIVREKNIEHGDKLKLIKSYTQNEQTYYDFDIVEKVSLIQHERIQFNYCILEKNENSWYVEQHEPFKKAGNNKRININWNDAPYRINLNEVDVHALNLNAGNLIDVAFWEDNPSSPKIIWYHRNL